MKRLVLLILTSLVLGSSVVAQNDFSDLDRIREGIEENVRDTMKGWKSYHIEPLTFGNMPPAAELRIRQWVSGERNVRVVLHRYPSIAEATMALRQFVASSRVRDQIYDLADEAYVHGGRNAIAFRKDNLLVYVSAIVIKEHYTEEEKKDPMSMTGFDLKEEAALIETFAGHVAAALRKL